MIVGSATRAIVMLGLLLPACSSPQAPVEPPTTQSPSAAADTIELSAEERRNAGIEVTAARLLTQAARLTATGRLALDETRTARVGSLQEAVILDTRAQVGDRVGRGQLLATMHGHALHDAWAGYRKAVAERRRAENQLAYATEANERARRLYADRAIALQELQRSDVDRVTALESLEIAKAEILRAIEELEHVGVNVSETAGEPVAAPDSAEQIPVRSPMQGAVLERLVTPGTTVVPGTPLFVISDLTTLWAIAEVDESHIARIRRGSPAEIVVGAYPGERFPGTITFVSDTVNPDTRRLMVRSTVPNSSGRLKPDMFATVTLGDARPREVVAVPAAAVQPMGGRSVVFVEERPGRFVARQVDAGPQSEGNVEILRGAAAGEQVVVAGSFVLKSELASAAER
jgi:cobalt-zinc-cadmium efflux system membrane fusion protein